MPQIVDLFLGRYTAEEIQDSLDRFRLQKKIHDARSRAKRDGMGWKMPNKIAPVDNDLVDLAPQWSPEQYERMNARFCGAMRAAINAGMEQAKIGIVTKPMTDMARTVRAVPLRLYGNCSLADA